MVGQWYMPSHTFLLAWIQLPLFTDRNFFAFFFHVSSLENWFSVHKQSLLEEDKCTQASHHPTVCWVGVQH